MGKSVTMDSVVINIETEVGNSGAKVSELAGHLTTLRNSLKGGFNNLNKLATALGTLKENTSDFKSVTKALSGINGIVEPLNQLSEVKSPTGLKKIVDRLNDLAKTSNKLSGIATNLKSVNTLVTQLNKLSDIQPSKGLSSIVKSLTEFTKIKGDITGVVKSAQALPKLAEALQPLGKLGDMNGLKKGVESLEKLPGLLNKLDVQAFENLARVSNELAQSLTPLADKMQQVAQGYSAFSKIQNTFGKSASTATRYAKQQKSIIGELGSFASRSIKWITRLSSSLTLAFGRKAANNLKNFNSKFKQVYLSLLGTRTLFTMIRKAASEYQAFDQSLQKFTTNIWRAFGAQLAPVIEYAMGLFKQFVRVIYSVVYAITGIDLIARANEKAMQSWGKAAKDTLGNLQKFDDLNVVEFPKASGDDNELIELDKIDLSPIQKVIDWVKKLKQEIIDAWNSGEWYGVGKVLAEGINMGVQTSLSSFDMIRNKLFETGTSMGDLFNGVIENTEWDDVGKFLTEAFKLLPDSITNMLSTVNWVALGNGLNEFFKGFDAVEIVKSIGRALVTSLSDIGTVLAQIEWDLVGEEFGNVIKLTLNGISDFLKDIPWKNVGEELRKAIVSMDWEGIWDSVVELAKTAFSGIKDFVAGLFDLDSTELASIETVLVGIGTAFATYKIVNSIDNMVTALSKLSKIKSWTGNISKLLSTLGKSKTTLTENPLLNGDILKMQKVNDLSKYSSSSVAGVSGALDSTSTLSNKVKGSSGSFSLTDTKSVLDGIRNLATIIGALSVLVLAMGALTKIPGFTDLTSSGIEEFVKLFTGLGKITIPLAAFSLGTVVLGKIGFSTILQGVGGLATVISGMTALVTAIGFILSLGELSTFLSGGIDMLKITFNGLHDIIVPLGVVSALVVGLGFATPAVVLSGMGGLASIIGGLEIILVALGALKQIPGFEWIVGEGGKVLSQLGDIIGNFGGSIIAGFADKAFESLGDIGTHLSEFMNNAKPFFDGVANIKKESAEGVKYVAEAILAISAGNLLDSITSWLDGDASLSSFGKELAEFGPYLADYAVSVKDIDGAVVTSSANAAKSLAELANNLPKHSGLKQWFTGDTTLAKFGEQLPGFGKDIMAYANNIANLDTAILTKSATAAGALAELSANLPNKGGIVAWFTGDNTLEDFGIMLNTFGTDFKGYYGKISKFSYDKLNNTTSTLERIVVMMETIKSKKLADTIDSFGTALNGFGPKIVDFFNNWFSFVTGQAVGQVFGEGVAKGIIKGVKQNASIQLKLSESGGGVISTYKLSGYATGGFPESGQYFYARENGIPEMVGAIGTKTAVANNVQIVEAVSVGVEQAMLSALSNEGFNPTIVVNVGNKKLYEGQQAFNKTQQNKYGTINLY